MKLKSFFIPVALVFLLAASSWAEDNAPVPLDDLPDFSISQGQVMYERYCLFCHGEKGEGDGQNAFSQPHRPANLWQIVPERSDQQLYEVITRGGEETYISPDMPSFAHTLSDRQVNKLVRYIRRFSGEN